MAISDAVADAPPCFVSQAAVSRHMRCEATQSSMQSVIDIAIPSIRCCGNLPCTASSAAPAPTLASAAPRNADAIARTSGSRVARPPARNARRAAERWRTCRAERRASHVPHIVTFRPEPPVTACVSDNYARTAIMARGTKSEYPATAEIIAPAIAGAFRAATR